MTHTIKWNGFNNDNVRSVLSTNLKYASKKQTAMSVCAIHNEVIMYFSHNANKVGFEVKQAKSFNKEIEKLIIHSFVNILEVWCVHHSCREYPFSQNLLWSLCLHFSLVFTSLEFTTNILSIPGAVWYVDHLRCNHKHALDYVFCCII